MAKTLFLNVEDCNTVKFQNPKQKDSCEKNTVSLNACLSRALMEDFNSYFESSFFSKLVFEFLDFFFQPDSWTCRSESYPRLQYSSSLIVTKRQRRIPGCNWLTNKALRSSRLNWNLKQTITQFRPRCKQTLLRKVYDTCSKSPIIKTYLAEILLTLRLGIS